MAVDITITFDVKMGRRGMLGSFIFIHMLIVVLTALMLKRHVKSYQLVSSASYLPIQS